MSLKSYKNIKRKWELLTHICEKIIKTLDDPDPDIFNLRDICKAIDDETVYWYGGKHTAEWVEDYKDIVEVFTDLLTHIDDKIFYYMRMKVVISGAYCTACEINKSRSTSCRSISCRFTCFLHDEVCRYEGLYFQAKSLTYELEERYET